MYDEGITPLFSKFFYKNAKTDKYSLKNKCVQIVPLASYDRSYSSWGGSSMLDIKIKEAYDTLKEVAADVSRMVCPISC